MNTTLRLSLAFAGILGATGCPNDRSEPPPEPVPEDTTDDRSGTLVLTGTPFEAPELDAVYVDAMTPGGDAYGALLAGDGITCDSALAYLDAIDVAAAEAETDGDWEAAADAAWAAAADTFELPGWLVAITWFGADAEELSFPEYAGVSVGTVIEEDGRLEYDWGLYGYLAPQDAEFELPGSLWDGTLMASMTVEGTWTEDPAGDPADGEDVTVDVAFWVPVCSAGEAA